MNTKNFLAIAACIIMGVSLSACKKNKVAETIDELETTFEMSENQARADNLTQDAGDVSEEAAARFGLFGGAALCGLPTTMNWIGACATITVSGNFPAKNVRIDFGTGCTSPNGVVRKGVMNIVLTDSIRIPGSKATTTFENYFVNGYKKEGVIVRTNTSVVGAINRSVNRVVTGGQITSPTGTVWQHESNINIVQTTGGITPCDIRDDEYDLTGTRTTTNAQGKVRVSTTQTALHKKVNCANIDAGILKVQGPNHFALIDFGNGTCDNLATISIDGRPARNITLR
jgi:hypothetical protein